MSELNGELKLSEVTQETLEKVEYKDLLSTFTALGVKEAWKPGTKKDVMIKNALSLISTVKELENIENPSEDTKELALQLEEQKQIDEAKEAAKEIVGEIKKEIDEKISIKESILALNLSKEQIEKNLKNITAGLKVGIPAQRPILLLKQSILQEILEESSKDQGVVESSEEEE